MSVLIPVIKGEMGSRDYYVGTMTFQDLAAKVDFYNELQTGKDLEDLLQRELTNRSKEMTDYLLKQKERFYGAVILASWGGNPQYHKIKMEDHPLLDADFPFGILKFDGKQRYFALDGQHRLKSIKEAIDKDPDLRTEEISVIIIPHEQSEEGSIKTRRLFHTLNRYAKPTTSGENIQLDEDNVISIVTRRLLADIALLSQSKLELKKKAIGNTQDDKFTSLAALFAFNHNVIQSFYNFDKEFLRFRPQVDSIERVYFLINSLWNYLEKNVQEFSDISKGVRDPGSYRSPNEGDEFGNIWFRPLGIEVMGAVFAAEIRKYLELSYWDIEDSATMNADWSKALEKSLQLPVTIGEKPWLGSIFRNGKMENSGKKLATNLALYMIGESKLEDHALLDHYRGHSGDDSLTLPSQV